MPLSAPDSNEEEANSHMFQLFAELPEIPDLPDPQSRESHSLVLASASPRRRELLATYGLRFKWFSPDVVEQHQDHETAQEYVVRNALLKAQDIAMRFPDACFNALILAGDTVVVSSEGKILEKPRDANHAIETLESLSGKRHKVVSSIVICCGKTIQFNEDGPSTFNAINKLVVETEVEFSQIPHDWIKNYVKTGEPLDKAGSYGIQGIAGAFVRRIEGSYTNVVGLPLNECLHLVYELLQVRSFYLATAHALGPKELLLKKNFSKIVAISKRQPAYCMRLAYRFGQRDFGENYLQELKSKKTDLHDLTGIVWHFTGTLQSNKIKEVAKYADVVHALDSVSKAAELNKSCLETGRKIKVFLKAEVSSLTPASSGLNWKDARTLAEFVKTCEMLEWCGFMGMGPLGATRDELYELFLSFMNHGREVWNETHGVFEPKMSAVLSEELQFSLGMSGDFDIACQVAAEHQFNIPLMRIGSAIFGNR